MTESSGMVPAAPSAAVPAAAGDGPTTTALFGLQFTIKGKPVTITSGDIATAASKGIEFTLPGPVDLGTINDLIGWINTTFSVNIPPATSLPSPLDKVVGTLTSIDFVVTTFHVKLPGTGGGNTQYTLGMTATLANPINLIPNSTALQITGALVGVSNEPQPAPPPS